MTSSPDFLPTESPRRYRTLIQIGAVFLLVNFAVRLCLTAWEFAHGSEILGLAGIVALGLAHDLAALAFLLLPFSLLHSLLGDGKRQRQWHAALSSALATGSVLLMLWVALAEFVFWNEFTARFNFIAVDYLIYTREVVGNIRESYPTGWLLGGLLLIATVLLASLAPRYLRAARAPCGPMSTRVAVPTVCLLAIVCSQTVLDDMPRERLPNAVARELAGNGYFDFVRAFRSNDLDFASFYRVEAALTAHNALRAEFEEARSSAVFFDGGHPISRRIVAPAPLKPLNVVMVSIESLGSDYVESFGGRKGLTPNLDELAANGLRFTQLYATGQRTVRGLEALTLSIPPTPGHAIPMRRNLQPMQSLGGVLREHGYEPLYLYGGYSAFDNMRTFFGNHGYTVIDRTAIASSRIAHENIWGVADEHLFDLTLDELDARAARGQRVFAHVMTTSNHRPYTYPDGRIDIASGTGRDGTVKYTDWAIGRFVRMARERTWFRDTVFVFVADHTSGGRGRTDLPPDNYRIPMIIFSPAHVAAGAIDHLASQIDVAPTLLALLNVSYESRFFGQDILTEGKHHQRAFLSNYLTVGYLQDGVVVELKPKSLARAVEADSGALLPIDDPTIKHLLEEAIAYYQLASATLKTDRHAAR